MSQAGVPPSWFSKVGLLLYVAVQGYVMGQHLWARPGSQPAHESHLPCNLPEASTL